VIKRFAKNLNHGFSQIALKTSALRVLHLWLMGLIKAETAPEGDPAKVQTGPLPT